ncbi:MAG: hypothetical protein ACE5H5_02840 [Nitrospinota bacterium]
MRYTTLVVLMAVALVLAVLVSPAYAWHCPKLAGDAKALIEKAEKRGGDPAKIQQAKSLVDEGLALHNGGKHNEAMETLARAVKTAVHSVTQKGGGTSKKGTGW